MKPEVQHCRSCGAAIYWAQTATSSMPIDVEPREDGNILLTLTPRGMLKARVLRAADTVDPTRNRYTSHFATCPHARGHRRTR